MHDFFYLICYGQIFIKYSIIFYQIFVDRTFRASLLDNAGLNIPEIVFSTIVDYEIDMLKRMTFLNTRILIVTKSLDTLNYSKFRKNFKKKFFG